MKKVETVTFHLANNYGAVLQAYALQKVISQKYNTEILNYDNKFISNNYKAFKQASKNPIKTVYHFAKDICNYNKEIKRIRLFDNFRNNYLKMSNHFTNDENPQYPTADVYIVGSDQVWNPFLTNGVDNVYLLDKLENTKKISYAASSGDIKYIDENKEEFFTKFNAFDYVSVREEKLKNYLIKNGRKNVDVVLDPTLLLTKEMWEEFAGKERIEKDKYVFVYSVNNANKLFIKFVNKFAKEKGLKIVFFDKNDIKNCYKYSKKSYYSTGPVEFVNLLFYADYVITTSFHGTALSCILNKNFFAVLSTFPDRLDTLLEILNLKDRIIYNMCDYEKALSNVIDWRKVNNLLKIARDKSLAWLNNSIECDKNE